MYFHVVYEVLDFLVRFADFGHIFGRVLALFHFEHDGLRFHGAVLSLQFKILDLVVWAEEIEVVLVILPGVQELFCVFVVAKFFVGASLQSDLRFLVNRFLRSVPASVTLPK